MQRPSPQSPQYLVRWGGLIGSPILAFIVFFALSGDVSQGNLTEPGRRVIGVAVLMAGWWLTEALPLAATALLPLALFPLLDIAPIRTAAAPYADDMIYLFLGGFILGKAFERSGLHQRVALRTLLAIGLRPPAAIGGMMVATALISMWVSNTATAILMLPIALSLIAQVEQSVEGDSGGAGGWDTLMVRRFSASMLLGLAYAASIGGMATPLGTPPNLQFVSNARELFNDDFSFARWVRLGVPLTVILLPLAWALLTFGLFRVEARHIPGGREQIQARLRSLGRPTASEAVTFSVFMVAVVFWIGRDFISRRLGLVNVDERGVRWLPLTDAGIAVIAACALFIIPARRAPLRPVLQAADIDTIPWSILVLFGGGLSLAAAMKSSGVDMYLGSLFAGLGGLPKPVLLLAIAGSVTLMSELASNTAVAASTLPVLAAAATGIGVHPYELMVPATFAASCGFMLPVATPPNAIVFGSGRVTTREMARAGVLLDVLCVVTISVFMWLAGPYLLGPI